MPSGGLVRKGDLGNLGGFGDSRGADAWLISGWFLGVGRAWARLNFLHNPHHLPNPPSGRNSRRKQTPNPALDSAFYVAEGRLGADEAAADAAEGGAGGEAGDAADYGAAYGADDAAEDGAG